MPIIPRIKPTLWRKLRPSVMETLAFVATAAMALLVREGMAALFEAGTGGRLIEMAMRAFN